MGKIKKAQSGYDLVKKKQTLSKSVSKYKSPDGNYTTKFKRFKRDDPNDLVPSKIAERRTLKGLLSGAKKAEGKLDVSKLKKGGKIKPKASNVSKKLGSAKKSIGNMRFTKKKK
jgi:hypothetical protein